MSSNRNAINRRRLLCGIVGLVGAIWTLSAAPTIVQAADDIVLGASVPLSGPLAGFGAYIKWGYEAAVADVNANGGIDIGGQKRKVTLVLRDDKTDPNVAASNVDALITRDKAVGILGSCTPPLVNAGALVAERRRVPFVTGSAPLESFKAARKWTYAWDLFFHEPDLASAPFRMLADLKLETNGKIAILHENGPDGQVVGGTVWPALAKDFGKEVVVSSAFPVDNMQFNSILSDAKAKDADIVLVMSTTPQALAIRKQMASIDYKPKMIVMEKGGEPVQFAEAAGALANGVLVGGYWDASFPYPGATDLSARYQKETGLTSSQHIADSYAVAQVMMDAISKAQSTEAKAINTAIGATDKTYVVGPIKFDEFHTAKLPTVQMQWQDGKTKVVWPSDQKSGDIQFPIP